MRSASKSGGFQERGVTVVTEFSAIRTEGMAVTLAEFTA